MHSPDWELISRATRSPGARRRPLRDTHLTDAWPGGEMPTMTGDLQACATHAFLAEAEDVAYARAFTRLVLADVARDDPDHVDDVVLVVSELLTNAVRHARDIRKTWVDLHLWPQWTIVKVHDTDPAVHHTHTEPDDDGDPAESGRGLFIVETIAARFDWNFGLISKAAVAAILRSDAKLSADDVLAIDEAMAR